MTTPKVILLKASKTQDTYKSELVAAGFRNCHQVSPITFEFQEQAIEKELSQSLRSPHCYSALVLTSPRCVEAVKKAKCDISELKPWQNKVFVIGKATAQAVENILQIRPLGEDTGNAEELCKRILVPILGENVALKVLMPCSDQRMDTISHILNAHNIPIQEIICYRTVQNPDIEEKLIPSLSVDCSSQETVVVFFSPSGVDAVKQYLESYNAKFIAIGPTTANAVRSAGFPLLDICPKPTADALIVVLNRHYSNNY